LGYISLEPSKTVKVEYEIERPDDGSCFRTLHQKVPISSLFWQYHYHPEIELTCVLGGTGTRHIGNHLSNYTGGDLVLIGSDLPHSGLGWRGSDPHEEIVVQFRREVILPYADHFPEMKNVLRLIERAKFGILFSGRTKAEATRRLQTMPGLPPFERYIRLLEVLQYLSQSPEYTLLNRQALQSAGIDKHKTRLQKVLTYVERHYHEKIDIRKAAELASISLPSFCNYFKKTTNITFTDFVNQYRVQMACLQLQEDKTVAEICFECGFKNVTYFNKVFKQLLGVTPTTFRKGIKDA
jgi:AraC-like DNA-binding protein